MVLEPDNYTEHLPLLPEGLEPAIRKALGVLFVRQLEGLEGHSKLQNHVLKGHVATKTNARGAAIMH